MSTQEAEVVESTQAVAIRERSSVLLMPVMDVNTARHRLAEFQDFCQSYLSESKDGGNDGGDYGIIPGTKKKTLLKSGADKLCEIYGLYDEYIIKETIDWSKGLFDYELTCVLKSRRDDSVVGSGVGSCSSFESKYRWREAPRICPTCSNAGSLIKGKAEFGGGWICWGKKGGCGAKFKDGDKAVEGQVVGRIENPDVADVKNTVLKMGKKRAKIDAVIGVTRSSGIFTQDMEDLSHTPIPPKPEPETTTEPVEIGKPRNPSSGAADANIKGASVASKAPEVKPSEAPQPSSPYISAGQVANFAKTFREALPLHAKKDEEGLRHDWLRINGFLDSTGAPSSKIITTQDFEDARARAAKWARTVPKPAFTATNDDIPF